MRKMRSNSITQAARNADEAGDIGSRDIFERTAMDEEGHMEWLDLQLSLLKKWASRPI